MLIIDMYNFAKTLLIVQASHNNFKLNQSINWILAMFFYLILYKGCVSWITMPHDGHLFTRLTCLTRQLLQTVKKKNRNN